MHRLDLGVTAVYVLPRGQGRYLLVDAGYAHDEKALHAGLRAVGINLGDVSHVLLTHHHDDHAGLVARLTTQCPDLQVILHERAVPLLAHGANDLTQGGYWLNRRVRVLGGLKGVVEPGWSAHRFPPYRVRPGDIAVSDDDDQVLRRLGISGTIIALPGHTVDSIGIVLDDGNAFVGDAAANFLRFAGTRHCVVFLTDLDQYYASWRRLIEAGARFIHPGHGGAFPIQDLKRDLDANPKSSLIAYSR
jgi:glyoxylase-like metal-dependent hydrolase (beta-lactamase superfamily II)